LSTRQAIPSAPVPVASTTGPAMPTGLPGSGVAADQAPPEGRSKSRGPPA
jgi:hypothetical protein